MLLWKLCCKLEDIYLGATCRPWQVKPSVCNFSASSLHLKISPLPWWLQSHAALPRESCADWIRRVQARSQTKWWQRHITWTTSSSWQLGCLKFIKTSRWALSPPSPNLHLGQGSNQCSMHVHLPSAPALSQIFCQTLLWCQKTFHACANATSANYFA